MVAGADVRDEELEVDGLRHSDWLVTLPLLVLKLYHVINNPNKDLFFDNAELSALMAMLMILFGAIARLARCCPRSQRIRTSPTAGS